METLAVVRLAALNGLVEDDVDMTMSFDAADQAPATLNGIAASIISFFNTANTNSTMAAYISGVMSRAANASRVLFYDVSGALDGGPHGSPVHQVNWTLGAASGGAASCWPSECAIVISFNGDLSGVPETAPNPTPPPTTIRPASRRKGRFYFGPLSPLALTGAATTEPRVSVDFFTNVDVAAFRFMDERGGDFCVWSRADETFYPVAPNGQWHVDNAVDIQRKRGKNATQRTLVWP